MKKEELEIEEEWIHEKVKEKLKLQVFLLFFLIRHVYLHDIIKCTFLTFSYYFNFLIYNLYIIVV